MKLRKASQLIKNQSVVAKLEQLQNLGIQISIDDFGTGYSSLAYLTKYPINTLKIAREFICGITTSPLEEAIVSSIITLSKELNLEVIAEGVETEEEWKFYINKIVITFKDSLLANLFLVKTFDVTP